MSGTVLSGMLQRLLNALPTNWMPKGSADVNGNVYRIYAQMSGSATVYKFLYSQLQFLQDQNRIQTQTGGFLDLTARGYFGETLLRKPGESDVNYRTRIIANFFRPQGTYDAMIQAITSLTGNAPVILRPKRPADMGVYGGAGLPISQNGVRRAYSLCGAYGSLLMKYQAGIQVSASAGGGIPNVQGYGTLIGKTAVQNVGAGGYGKGWLEYADLSQMVGGVSDLDIYNTILQTKLEGTLVWVQIVPPTQHTSSNVDFTDDFSSDFA